MAGGEVAYQKAIKGEPKLMSTKSMILMSLYSLESGLKNIEGLQPVKHSMSDISQKIQRLLFKNKLRDKELEASMEGLVKQGFVELQDEILSKYFSLSATGTEIGRHHLSIFEA